MSHALLALLVQAIAVISDLASRRIPNRLLVGAILSHLIIWLLLQEFPPASFARLSLIVIVAVAILMPRSRTFLDDHLGMGDIKLLVYLLIFFFPFIRPQVWLMAFSAASLIVIFLTRSTVRSSLPLAPIIFIASLTSLVEASL